MEMTALEVTVDQLRTSVDHIKDELSDIYERLRVVETADAVTQEQYKHILEKLGDQETQLSTVLAKLDELSRKPEKRYESAVSALIGSGVGAAVSTLAHKFFGG